VLQRSEQLPPQVGAHSNKNAGCDVCGQSAVAGEAERCQQRRGLCCTGGARQGPCPQRGVSPFARLLLQQVLLRCLLLRHEPEHR
jgi:hypothetical protein